MQQNFCKYLIFLFLNVSFAEKAITQPSERYWGRFSIPKGIEGQWSFEERDFTLSFDEYGINRDNQTWPYRFIKQRGDTTIFQVEFRRTFVELEVILVNPQTLKLRTHDQIFFPSYDFLEFTTIKRQSQVPETPQEFKDLAGITANVLFEGKLIPENIVVMETLNKKWVHNAQRLSKFPQNLLGNWQYIFSNDDQLGITIYPEGILVRQNNMASYPVHYNELMHLYEYNGIYVASFKRDRYPSDGTLWLKLQGDSLTIQFFGFGIQWGQPQRVYNKKHNLESNSLPEKLQKNYALDEIVVNGKFLGNKIYLSDCKIKLSAQHLNWDQHQLEVKAVYKGFLAQSKQKEFSNYDIFLIEPSTQKEHFISLIFDPTVQSYQLYAFGFPRLDEAGVVSVFPWKFYLPKTGEISTDLYQILTGLGTLTLLLFIAGIVMYAYYLRRQRKQAQLALRGIRAQLNPHFLFNALSSIQSLVNRNDQEGANRYLSGFSKLLRHTLYHSDQDYSSLEEELNHLRQYCELESLRTPFEYAFIVDEKIDTFNTEIPSMLLQPYVENAILHGLREHTKQPRLEVIIREAGKSLLCEICDNGPGIEASKAQKKSNPMIKPQLHGMSLSAERIRLLNLRLRKKICIQVIDRRQMKQQSGTCIIISIPNNTTA